MSIRSHLSEFHATAAEHHEKMAKSHEALAAIHKSMCKSAKEHGLAAEAEAIATHHADLAKAHTEFAGYHEAACDKCNKAVDAEMEKRATLTPQISAVTPTPPHIKMVARPGTQLVYTAPNAPNVPTEFQKMFSLEDGSEADL